MRAIALMALLAATADAQERPNAPLTLDQAVEFALAHHPALAGGHRERRGAPRAGVGRALGLSAVGRSGARDQRGHRQRAARRADSDAGYPRRLGPADGAIVQRCVARHRHRRGRARGMRSVSSRRWRIVDAALAEQAQARAAVDVRRLAVAFARGGSVPRRRDARRDGARGTRHRRARAHLRHHRRGADEAGAAPRRRRVARAGGAGAGGDAAHPRGAGRSRQPHRAGARARRRRRAGRDRRRQVCSRRPPVAQAPRGYQAPARARSRGGGALGAGPQARRRAAVSAAARSVRLAVGARQRPHLGNAAARAPALASFPTRRTGSRACADVARRRRW